MNRKLKIPNQVATETFTTIPKTSNVRLLGGDAIKVSDKDQYLDFIDLVTLEDKFFYQLSSICKRDGVERAERGIGHLEKDSDGFILVRDEPFYWEEDYKPVFHDGPLEFFEVDNTYIANNYVPQNIFEYLVVEPHSIVYSNSNGFPQVVQLENDSILACVNGEIRSLTFEQLAERLNEYT